MSFQLQIGLQFGFGEVEFPGADLFGVMAPIPWHDIVVAAFLGNEGGDIGLLLSRPRHRLRPDGAQQIVHGFRRLRHGVVELQLGEIGVAEKLCFFGTQLERFGNDGAIVGFAAVSSPRHPGLESLFAEIATLGERQERLDDRAR